MDFTKKVPVILSPQYDQTFRRSVRDEKGAVSEILMFARGEVVFVPAECYPAIKRDVGNALLVCTETEKGVLKLDRDATAAFKQYLETGQPPAAAGPATDGDALPPPRKSSKKGKRDGSAGPDEPLYDEAVPQ